VVDCGEDSVELDGVVAELERRGLRRVLCEGGPRLFASLLGAGLVDELCLTLAPVLTAGDGPRITLGPSLPAPQPATLVSALEAESALLLRYTLR
jgi:5-amino-6-(5-phosphoribosylamino)uracil reductase